LGADVFGYSPWKQLINAVDRLVGDALEHVLQVSRKRSSKRVDLSGRSS
jgi:hypothetical protein